MLKEQQKEKMQSQWAIESKQASPQAYKKQQEERFWWDEMKWFVSQSQNTTSVKHFPCLTPATIKLCPILTNILQSRTSRCKYVMQREDVNA